METLYLVLFLIGLVFAIVTLFVGDIFHLHFDASGGHLPFFSPTTIASFITVFGGLGYFLMKNTELSQFLIAVIAIAAALAASTGMFLLVVVPLQAANHSTAKSSKELIGGRAEVITSIVSTSRGEIIYEQGGTRLSAPAKSRHGETILQGEYVRVVEELGGTFVVEKL
ncbi:hypothetical protein Back11_58450 [Paenibacillus baekrokdamisoli]|uniref:Membrane protein NfeD2 N-terminal transmembrane domain-containing protein n=1 Tax=Paenibacillus baekrokdamisoli TaxID=1712516 RepID=A0A3G9IZZ9_9BACL|nr:NfeD family protein [Paenibacillus baekrokdamisoli]MBB3071469.1 membrane-bound ClpP family serine protease [Paenibacillus baekrokdamisoli]BBH24500.1 hypothetical protein Back11_58450 [Paenibacillus baekrokdamisoli]